MRQFPIELKSEFFLDLLETYADFMDKNAEQVTNLEVHNMFIWGGTSYDKDRVCGSLQGLKWRLARWQ